LRGFADHPATYHYWDAGRLVISGTVVAMDNWMVSPRYDMRSLREARVSPVDVFEDAIQDWILDYAAKLADLKENAAGMAVMNLVVAYPETIECYRAGRDSKGELKRFFRDGMRGCSRNWPTCRMLGWIGSAMTCGLACITAAC
jgi:hypothetical protein